MLKMKVVGKTHAGLSYGQWRASEDGFCIEMVDEYGPYTLAFSASDLPEGISVGDELVFVKKN